MAFSFASIASISDDTGQSANDFVTDDSTISISGFALGTGNMGFWLASPSFPSPVYLGFIHIGATDSHIWTFNGLSSFALPDDNYTIIITNGTGAASLVTPLDTQALTIDTAAPTVTINAVEGDDVLTAPEASDGLQVSGTATGADGQAVTVGVYDAFDNLLFTKIGTVSAGAWAVTFNATQAQTLTGTDYSIRASVTDAAGNTGSSGEHDFTSTVCFMPGTKVRTPGGEIAVEMLKRGDLVTTADGRSEPITWIGRQTVSKLFADPIRVWPIRIKAGALDENVPSRDLLVSPDHAVLVDGVLVQAGALVNGTSIVRESDIPATYTYYHVETADHSLILAENVPAETFIDNVDRLAFDNWSEHQALYPEGKPIQEMPYPRAQSSRQIPLATRERLSQRGTALFGQDVVSAA